MNIMNIMNVFRPSHVEEAPLPRVGAWKNVHNVHDVLAWILKTVAVVQLKVIQR